MGQIVLFLDKEHIQEVYEILCELPFEKPTTSDSEPPTQRYAGIEQILTQLEERLVDMEGWT